MKYYYQTDGDTMLCNGKTQIPDDQIFTEESGEIRNWDNLIKMMTPADEVYVTSVSQIAEDVEELTKKLNDCLLNNIHLKLMDDRSIDPEIILSFIKFIKEKSRLKQYEKQMEGIRKALDDKRQGLREYGRPKKDLPDDFEANIRKIIKKELTHEEYRQQIGMKKSTYFAKVKELRKNKGI